MYLFKNHQSPFFQIVYFPDGERTTVSTKTKNKSEAMEFLFKFKNSFEERPHEIIPQEEEIAITISQFMQEYFHI